MARFAPLGACAGALSREGSESGNPFTAERLTKTGMCMNLLEVVREWQMKAKSIAPPEGTRIRRVRGGLPGPAFFPEGFGLQNPRAGAEWPRWMAVGHNFSCEDYRTEIDGAGREDDKATWRNLSKLLTDVPFPIESCFMTNWFVGLQPGNKQVGGFLSRPDSRFELDCRELLLEQIRTIKPEVILLLGKEVVQRAFQIIPILRPWAHTATWRDIDTSVLGPVVRGVQVPGTTVSTRIIALLHPCESQRNRKHRSVTFPVENPEVEMIRNVVAGRPWNWSA